MAELTKFAKNRLDAGIPHTDIAEQTPMQWMGGRRWPVGIWQFHSHEQPRTKRHPAQLMAGCLCVWGLCLKKNRHRICLCSESHRQKWT